MSQTTNRGLSSQQQAALHAMGIQVWHERKRVNDGPVDAAVESSDPMSMDWSALQQCVQACQACDLHQTRTQTVFGVGDRQADWLIIGEAPGEQEDLRGEPFVGAAGQLLNQMLKAINLSRQNVFIANVLKCRPPGNRDPKAEEADACKAYLTRQIQLLQPKIILVVGRIAAQQLLQVTTPVGKLRGVIHCLNPFNIPLVVTYHPAYLLRSPLAKREAWKDLCLAKSTLNEGG